MSRWCSGGRRGVHIQGPGRSSGSHAIFTLQRGGTCTVTFVEFLAPTASERGHVVLKDVRGGDVSVVDLQDPRDAHVHPVCDWPGQPLARRRDLARTAAW